MASVIDSLSHEARPAPAEAAHVENLGIDSPNHRDARLDDFIDDPFLDHAIHR